MESKQVLRIEHSNGWGLFNFTDHPSYSETEGYIYDMEETKEMAFRHNKFHTPENDGLSRHASKQDWFCSYKSIEQMQDWILKEELNFLVKNFDLKVYLITVTQWQEGRDQVLYTKESIISKKDITELC